MKKPFPILKDEQLQAQLDKDGYVLFDFLNQAEVAELQRLFDELHKDRTDIPYDTLYTCLHNADLEYRRVMNEKLTAICEPAMYKHFLEAKNTVFTFQIKGMGPDSEFYVHQDWSFTDENLGYFTYTFWLPLVESHADNGTVAFFPGSHKFLRDIRGANIHPVFNHVRTRLIPHLKNVTVGAGQLLLFDSAVIHYSSPNLSDDIRVSVMTNVMRKEAELFLYFRNKENNDLVDEYSVPDDFFMHYGNAKEEYMSPPSFAKYKQTFELKEDFYDEKRLDQLVKKMKGEGFINKLKAIYETF